ncbi:MaoC/PaaZ C-terminal domain-containing protein [Sporichthya sp.]|uniref:MaoC/PaaZ C-terminal domain-containing protein n=1 Tax=Sporichthya sp. TaxID=65475 RepID=UPI0017936ABA|nr:MaoC/PaaZ C-terminal domain-containing protein [Sporichthya sp.]MBA3744082.1 MaoC family dehydratase N-terminal domain-containing protein [Sporichthya sp.]
MSTRLAYGEPAVAPAPPPLTTPPLTRTDFVRYQGASGDVNPVHHDDTYARAVGFPSVFAPGMYAAGMMATYLTDWLGLPNIRRYAARFRDQAWPGDQLTFTASVARMEERGTERRAFVEATCDLGDGRTLLVAEATFLVPARELG